MEAKRAYHVIRPRLVQAIPIDIVGINAITANLAGEVDAALDEVAGSLVPDVDPCLVREVGVALPEQATVSGSIPDGVPVTVAFLDEAGVEVADDGRVGAVAGLHIW